MRESSAGCSINIRGNSIPNATYFYIPLILPWLSGPKTWTQTFCWHITKFCSLEPVGYASLTKRHPSLKYLNSRHL